MKHRYNLLLLVYFAFTATTLQANTETSEATNDVGPGYSQLVTLQAGPFRPAGITLSNGSYSFEYGQDALASYLFQAGWSARVFDFLGGVYLQESIGFTSFSGTAPSLQPGNSATRSLSAYMMSLDTRIMHSWEWFPWKPLIPFVEGGYQYTFYYQSGPSDLESSQGGIGNFTAGAGLRLWLNRASSLSHDHVSRLSTFPVFLTAKVNRIFPQDNGVNLSSTSYLAGLSFGL